VIFSLLWIAQRAKKATIISAPAGSGKTSLLHAW
jgi:ATP/maltotriose-dependent transcriptional regulator MalT